jgi:hypothetical protein
MSLTLKQKKNLRVEVPDTGANGRYGKSDGFTLQFSHDGKAAQVKVSEDVRWQLVGNVKGVISFLQKKSNALLEPIELDIYPYSDYGDESVAVTLTGWREATDAEIERAERAYEARQEEQKAREQHEVERARAVLKAAGEL